MSENQPTRPSNELAGGENPVPTEAKAQRPVWQRIVGFKRRPGKRIPFGFTLWGWLLIVGVFGFGGMAGMAEYSMQPDFCQSCHIMEPYYRAWHESNHKNVACVDCHFEPGIGKTLYGKFQASSQAIKYITHTYGSKPHAEVHDVSCLRSGCHEKRLLEGKVNWPVKSSRGETITIKFDHKPHLTEERRGQQLRCVSCHSQIVQGQHIVVTVDTCFLCHFKGKEHGRNEQTLGGCKACHDAPKTQIRLATGNFNHADYLTRGVTCQNCHSDVIKGDGAVPRQVCWNCHNQASQISRYGETRAMHEAHVSLHKVECSSCHIKIEHNLDAGASVLASVTPDGHVAITGSACNQCHQQTHGGPAELYRGIGGRGVPDMPSPMFRAQVDCIACHRHQLRTGESAQVVGQTYTAVQESCLYCHGNKYTGVLEDWKKRVNSQVASAE